MFQSGIFDLQYDFKELQVVPFDKVYNRKKLFMLSHNNSRRLHKRSLSNNAFSEEKKKFTIIEKLKLFSSAKKKKNKESSLIDPRILDKSREFDNR